MQPSVRAMAYLLLQHEPAPREALEFLAVSPAVAPLLSGHLATTMWPQASTPHAVANIQQTRKLLTFAFVQKLQRDAGLAEELRRVLARCQVADTLRLIPRHRCEFLKWLFFSAEDGTARAWRDMKLPWPVTALLDPHQVDAVTSNMAATADAASVVVAHFTGRLEARLPIQLTAFMRGVCQTMRASAESCTTFLEATKALPLHARQTLINVFASSSPHTLREFANSIVELWDVDGLEVDFARDDGTVVRMSFGWFLARSSNHQSLTTFLTLRKHRELLKELLHSDMPPGWTRVRMFEGASYLMALVAVPKPSVHFQAVVHRLLENMTAQQLRLQHACRVGTAATLLAQNFPATMTSIIQHHTFRAEQYRGFEVVGALNTIAASATTAALRIHMAPGARDDPDRTEAMAMPYKNLIHVMVSEWTPAQCNAHRAFQNQNGTLLQAMIKLGWDDIVDDMITAWSPQELNASHGFEDKTNAAWLWVMHTGTLPDRILRRWTLADIAMFRSAVPEIPAGVRITPRLAASLLAKAIFERYCRARSAGAGAGAGAGAERNELPLDVFQNPDFVQPIQWLAPRGNIVVFLDTMVRAARSLAMRTPPVQTCTVEQAASFIPWDDIRRDYTDRVVGIA